MTIEQAVQAKLLATVAVTALVSTRIYQLKLPQGATQSGPAVRLQLVDEPKDYHLRGETGATRARLQVDVYGSEKATSVSSDPYAAVTNAADAIDDVLSGTEFQSEGLQITASFRQSRRVGYEAPELSLIRCTQDFIVWSREL